MALPSCAGRSVKSAAEMARRLQGSASAAHLQEEWPGSEAEEGRRDRSRSCLCWRKAGRIPHAGRVCRQAHNQPQASRPASSSLLCLKQLEGSRGNGVGIGRAAAGARHGARLAALRGAVSSAAPAAGRQEDGQAVRRVGESASLQVPSTAGTAAAEAVHTCCGSEQVPGHARRGAEPPQRVLGCRRPGSPVVHHQVLGPPPVLGLISGHASRQLLQASQPSDQIHQSTRRSSGGERARNAHLLPPQAPGKLQQVLPRPSGSPPAPARASTPAAPACRWWQ